MQVGKGGHGGDGLHYRTSYRRVVCVFHVEVHGDEGRIRLQRHAGSMHQLRRGSVRKTVLQRLEVLAGRLRIRRHDPTMKHAPEGVCDADGPYRFGVRARWIGGLGQGDEAKGSGNMVEPAGKGKVDVVMLQPF